MTLTKEQSKTGGKLLSGVVVKAAMKDTATVAVESYVPHPKYKKYQRHTKKYLVHDAGNTAQVGDKVTIKEGRPISRHKSFTLVSRTSTASIDE